MTDDFQIFEPGLLRLQNGGTLPAPRLAYKTFGQLNAAGDNAVLFPTAFAGTHANNEALIAAWPSLDPERYFIVVPNLFGSGLSSSPSNTPAPFSRADFPQVTIHDNVACQYRLLTERLGVRRLHLIVGYSMGALQAYHWAAHYPHFVRAIAPICGSARISAHNYLFLEGVKAALKADAAFADGWYEAPPEKGLKAFATVYLGWALSQDFFREEAYRAFGVASVAEFVNLATANSAHVDANDRLAMIETWQHADLSTPTDDGAKALEAIRAHVIAMPCETDLYFRVEDNRREVARIVDAELRPIPSIWGHSAGAGSNPVDNAFIDAALKELLDVPRPYPPSVPS